jgi:hypothetical protein
VIVIALWWRFEARQHPELLFSAVGGVAGFTVFLYRQHLDETKLFKELFAEFNARYNALSDGLNATLFSTTSDPLSNSERDTLFKFFNLCAEEFFFYECGYIDRRVWESWYRGMSVFFKNQRIQALWKDDSKGNSYYNFQPPS